MKTQQLDLFQATDFKEAEQCAIAAKVTFADRRVIIDLREAEAELDRTTHSQGRVFRMWIAAPLKKIFQFANQVGSRDAKGLGVYLSALVKAIDELQLPGKDIETAVVRFNFQSTALYGALVSALRRRHIGLIRQFDHGDGTSMYMGAIRPVPSLRFRRFLTLAGKLDEVGLAIRANDEYISAGDKNPEHVMQYIVRIWGGIFQSAELSVCEQVRRHMGTSDDALPPTTIRCLEEINTAFGAAARFTLTSPLASTSMTLRRKVQAILTESLEVKTNADRDGSWRFLALLTESFLVAAAPRGLEIKPVDWVHPMKRKTEIRISL